MVCPALLDESGLGLQGDGGHCREWAAGGRCGCVCVTGRIELSRGHPEGRILGEILLKGGREKRDNWKGE